MQKFIIDPHFRRKGQMEPYLSNNKTLSLFPSLSHFTYQIYSEIEVTIIVLIGYTIAW